MISPQISIGSTIEILSTAAPSNVSNKLYVVDNKLYFNGVEVGGDNVIILDGSSD
jgi:hypothetical protein